MCFRYIYYTFILSELAMVSIENECLDELKYDNNWRIFFQKIQGKIVFFESNCANYKAL